MKITIHLLLALLASWSLYADSESGSCGSFNSSEPSSEDNDLRGCHLRGNYGYELTGTFGTGALNNTYGEIGVLTLDGHGHASASGVAVIDGRLVEDAHYICTYTFPDPSFPVNPKLGVLSCSRQVDARTPELLTYEISYGDCCDEIQILLLPVDSERSRFHFAQISGEAEK